MANEQKRQQMTEKFFYGKGLVGRNFLTLKDFQKKRLNTSLTLPQGSRHIKSRGSPCVL